MSFIKTNPKLYQKRKYKTADMFLLMIKCVPVHAIFRLLETIFRALMPTFTVLATASFIDTSIKIANGDAVISDVFVPIIFIISIMIYERLILSVLKLVDLDANNRVKRIARTEMTELRASLSYKHIENQENQDLINRVCGTCDGKVVELYHTMLNIISNIVTILGMVSLLLFYVWWMFIVIIALCIPLFYIAYKAGKKNYEVGREMTKFERKYGYLSGLLQNRDAIEERYIYGYVDEIDKKYADTYEFARKYKLKTEKKNYIRMKMTGLMFFCTTIIMALALIFPTVNGVITIGIFTSLVSSLSGMINSISWSVSWLVWSFSQSKEYLKDLTKFMEFEFLQDATTLPSFPPVEFESLEFKNVSFKYPGMENYVLKDMSFILEKGQHYSIVGANSAGKTTITKLITGLYSEFEGEIFINGKNIKEYTQAQLKSLCMVVYQDFARYYTSFFSNIALGDINSYKDEGDFLYTNDENAFKYKEAENNLESEFGQKVSNTCKLFDIETVALNLPKKYDTPLGKIRDEGMDVSGGEWQRIALARAVISPASLHILDEPTASLDPISESNVYKEFEKINKSQTTIFISHRLGSTKLADTILVISDGKVIETGTHNELMAKNGIYCEMYTAQSSWYVENTEATVNETEAVFNG